MRAPKDVIREGTWDSQALNSNPLLQAFCLEFVLASPLDLVSAAAWGVQQDS